MPTLRSACRALLALAILMTTGPATRASHFYTSVKDLRHRLEAAAARLPISDLERPEIPDQLERFLGMTPDGPGKVGSELDEDASSFEHYLELVEKVPIALVEDFRIVATNVRDSVRYFTLRSVSGVMLTVEATQLVDEGYLAQLGKGVAAGAGRVAGAGLYALCMVGREFILVSKDILIPGVMIVALSSFHAVTSAVMGAIALKDAMVRGAYAAAGATLRAARYLLVKTDQGFTFLAHKAVAALRAGKSIVSKGWRLSARAVRKCTDRCVTTFHYLREKVTPRAPERAENFQRLHR